MTKLKEKLRVYLDNCCYNRPYDDQSQQRIAEEAQAKIKLQDLIRSGEIELATSYMTAYENSVNPYDTRRRNIHFFQDRYATVHVLETLDNEVSHRATSIERTGVKHKDACHVVCAILAECDFLVTTDDRLLKYRTDEIKLIKPQELVARMEAENNGYEHG